MGWWLLSVGESGFGDEWRASPSRLIYPEASRPGVVAISGNGPWASCGHVRACPDGQPTSFGGVLDLAAGL